jgi:hypothetical protein
MGWALVVYPDTGGYDLVPDDPGVIADREQRGWERRALPDDVDADDEQAVLREAIERPPAATPILSEDEVAKLKGQALEDALDARGLPHTGTADDKWQRIAEHDNAQIHPEQPTDDAGSGTEQGVSE